MRRDWRFLSREKKGGERRDSEREVRCGERHCESGRGPFGVEYLVVGADDGAELRLRQKVLLLDYEVGMAVVLIAHAKDVGIVIEEEEVDVTGDGAERPLKAQHAVQHEPVSPRYH